MKFEFEIPYEQVCEAISNKLSDKDLVKVVRCKNCTKYHEKEGWCDEHSYFLDEEGNPCHPSESPNWKMFEPNDYCSCGEERKPKDEKGIR